ncbi:MAG: HEAT repeat domain-containing protein, partial [Armatimonadetes bacterium]|nr:HEAT repeat domain-containing protein [Armatimonadota bacterium]
MKLTRLSLVFATFVLLHNAGGWGDSEEEARLLAPRVNVYAIKHQLLGIGLPAVRPLFDQVASKTPVVAFEARSALRWIVYDVRFSAAKTEAIVHVAIEKLTSKEPSLRQYAAELLGFIGHADSASPKDSAAKLAPLLSDPDAGVRSTAILSLEKIPGPSATDTLAKALPSAQAETKVALLQSLGRRRDPKALKVLQSSTKDASEPVRLAAIGALGMVANTAGLSALEAVTRKGSALEKEKALVSMLGIANGMDPRKQAKQAESLCMRVLQLTGDEETRVEGLRVLSRFAGQDSVGLVSGLMKGASPRAQMEAVNTLRATSGKSAEEALLAAVASDNPDLQYAAIEALGERGDRSAVPALVSAAGDENERVRCAAVEALGRLGDAAALEAIAGAWEKGPGKVKQASVAACLEIANSLLAKGDKTKANVVFQQVEGRATTESDRIAAIDGIGRSGLADSLGRLEPLIKDKGAVREAAIKA